MLFILPARIALTECPSTVDQKQLDELGIDLSPKTRAMLQAQEGV